MDKQFKAHNLDREDMLDKAFHTNVVEIKKMAEQKYPDPNLSANPLTYGKRIGFVDGYLAAGATSSSTVKELERQVDRLKKIEAALEKLVELKIHKEQFGETPYYLSGKWTAWEKAKELVPYKSNL